MLRNLSEKLSTKFPSATHGYSMTKIVHLDDAFSVVFEQEASPVESQLLQQEHLKKDNKRKGKKKMKNEKPKDVGNFLVQKMRFWQKALGVNGLNYL